MKANDGLCFFIFMDLIFDNTNGIIPFIWRDTNVMG